MRVTVRQLVLPLAHGESELRTAAARKCGVAPDEISVLEILRRSIDARELRGQPVFVYSVLAEVSESIELGTSPDVLQAAGEEPQPRFSPAASAARPVVVGLGPAGIFAALTLAEAGLKPLICERGESSGARAASVGRFWSGGELNPESNVLFGEGGAGLFSDGKLTSRGKDRRRQAEVLRRFVEAGADPEIGYDAEPHLGSDRLAEIVPRLRERLLTLGCELRFGARLDGVRLERGALTGLRFGAEWIEATDCVLAPGASARGVYAFLHEAGVPLEAKPFAVGVRVELPQEAIDRAQWGALAGHPRLGAASFRLARRESGTYRACYSFCMCPGGSVICCASAPGGLTTNGVSLSARAGALGNAAFLVPVGEEDFPRGPLPQELSGLEFQAEIERRAFAAGGGDYAVPAARLEDFLNRSASASLPEPRSVRRARAAALDGILPDFVTATLRETLPKLLGQLRWRDAAATSVYAAETRSSSPVRIVRDESGASPGARGLFPAGEGAGYAGGIMSSAVDGMLAAERLLRRRCEA